MWVRKWLNEDGHCVPSVATIATDEVERICYKNGLLFHELLGAFSTAENAVPFRSGTHFLQLQRFRIRFVKASEMAPRPTDLADKYLSESFALNEEQEGQSWMMAAPSSSSPAPGAITKGGGGIGGAVVQVTERDQINQALATMDQMPWYKRFRTTLQRTLQYAEPELLECPAVMLLVVSSSNEAPMHCFEELSSSHHWPHVFQTGQYNAQDVAKVYVLLHDESEGGIAGVAQAAEILRQMKQAYPASPSKLLRINSLDGQISGSPLNLQQADIWVESGAEGGRPTASSIFFPDPNSPTLRYQPLISTRGCCLSSDDLLNLREFVMELTNKVVIPAMERRIFTLQASVTQSRKGVKNFVKSFWRKPRDAAEESAKDHLGGGRVVSRGGGSAGGGPIAGGSVLYRYDRIESQIRLLADTCFVMQDYESALSNYKLVRDDFKSDKAWLHLGSVFEMMALCYHLTDSTPADGRNRREMENALDEAVKAYLRKAEEENTGLRDGSTSGSSSNLGIHRSSLPVRLASRVSMLGAELLLASIPPKAVDAANLLISAARKESPLCGAVLIEQAAWAYLKGGNVRKFAFYMSMAGQMFLSCQQDKHSVRCCSSSLAMYEQSRWRHIVDHVHLTLARELIKLEKFELALYHLFKLLMMGGGGGEAVGGGLRQSYEIQQGIVRDLLQICREEPLALSSVVPYLEGAGGWVPISSGKAKSIGVGENGGGGGLKVISVSSVALPKALEETLTVTQGVVEPQGEEPSEMKAELQLELKTAAMLGEKGGSMREWVEGMSKVSKEEERLKALSANSQAKYAGLSWRGRDEAITISLEVVNPLNMPIVASEMQVTASFETCAPLISPSGFSSSSATSSSRRPPYPTSNDAPIDVEVQEVRLEPLERKRIYLRVHPKRCGILQITGLRWKLFGEIWASMAFETPGPLLQIWASMAFETPGPLLQDTLEKRASQARGPNTRLTSRIVPELPLLEAELEGISETLFQGEMVMGYLRLTNRGLVPAAQLFAKTNLLSWLYMREVASSSSSSSFSLKDPPAISLVGSSNSNNESIIGVQMSMVGVSGTVFRVIPGSLEPNQTLRIPLCVRGLGGGKQSLRLMVRYERGDQQQLTTSTSGSSSMVDGGGGQEYRYVEVMREICVLPSVSIVPSISPSYSMPGECILSVNASNYRTDGDASDRRIEIHKVVALSRLWRFEPIGGVSMGPLDSTGRRGGAASLGWQERTTLHYRLIPLEKEGDAVVYEHDLDIGALKEGPGLIQSSNKSSSGVDRRITSSEPSLDFLYVEHASQAYRTAKEEQRKRERAHAATGGSAGGTGQPLSLGEIKRKEAERKAKEAAAAAGGGENLAASLLQAMRSPRAGIGLILGMQGTAPLAALVPRGRATLNLLVTWSIAAAEGEDGTSGVGSKERRVGQHQILNHAVRPLTLDPTTAAPLTITVDYPSVVRGKMAANGFLHKCQAGVMVTVHNRMTDMPVDFVFEALAAPSGKRQTANKAAASPSFMWLGTTTRSIKGLAAGTSVRLPVRASFLRPGVYDLNRFRFVVHMAANAAQLAPGIVRSRLKLLSGNVVRVPYIFSAQYVIKVEAERGKEGGGGKGQGRENSGGERRGEGGGEGGAGGDDDGEMVMLVEREEEDEVLGEGGRRGMEELTSTKEGDKAALFPSSTTSATAATVFSSMSSSASDPSAASTLFDVQVPTEATTTTTTTTTAAASFLPSDISEGIAGMDTGGGGRQGMESMEDISPSFDVVGSSPVGMMGGGGTEAGGGERGGERRVQERQESAEEEVEVMEDQLFAEGEGGGVRGPAGGGVVIAGGDTEEAVYAGVGEGEPLPEEDGGVQA